MILHAHEFSVSGSVCQIMVHSASLARPNLRFSMSLSLRRAPLRAGVVNRYELSSPTMVSLIRVWAFSIKDGVFRQ